MMSKNLAIGVAAAIVLAIAGLSACADDDEDNPAALAKAVSEASVSLEQGLKAAETEGKPISAQFEGEDGALQLSVYTMKGDQFAEVLVDHRSGSIRNSEQITDPDDLKDARNRVKPWRRPSFRSPRRSRAQSGLTADFLR